MLKNKSFTTINLSGLSTGMACTMPILLWMYNERSWDTFPAHYQDVYHVLSNHNFNGETTTGPDMMYPLSKAAKAAFPEVQAATIASFGANTLFTVGDKKLAGFVALAIALFTVSLQAIKAAVTNPVKSLRTE